MSNLQIRKATRQKAKLRLALVGPSGSGKTYSALQIANGLGSRTLIVDTENGSADLYANMFDYDVITLQAPYLPTKYIEAIKAAEDNNYDTVILDSISPAWAGEGGLLDQQGRIADSGKGNSYTAWRTVTPQHNQLVDSIIQSKIHVIATMRAKTEYVLETNDKGRQVPKKVGMAPIQRDGMEYEFTVVFDIDSTHTATASKDRTGMFDSIFVKPTTKLGKQLKEWLENGIDPREARINEVAEQIKNVKTPTELKIIADNNLDLMEEPIIKEVGAEKKKEFLNSQLADVKDRLNNVITRQQIELIKVDLKYKNIKDTTEFKKLISKAELKIAKALEDTDTEDSEGEVDPSEYENITLEEGGTK